MDSRIASTFALTDDIAYRQILRRTCCWYLFWTLFAALFGFIYELLGRGVFSFFMLYAFGVPAILGLVPSFVMMLRTRPRKVVTACRWVWHAGVAALTFGCIFQGVMEIYGNFSGYVYVYFAVGAALIVIALLLSFKKVKSA